MKEKKSSGRRAYLRDFVRDASGTYVYTGRHMAYDADRGLSFRGWFVRLCVWNVLAVAAAVVSGFLPAEGLKNNAFLILPLVLELGFAVWALYGVLSSGGREPLREYVYERTLRPLAAKNTAALVLSLLGAVCGIVFALIRENGSVGVTVCYVGLKLIAAGSSLFSRQTAKGARWYVRETQVNPD